ncbi:MAG: glycerol-3-phosphate 1-O-acyltransferase PlsY [Candidatus Gastranaerophilales bacterium]|nr:glycerol-3-phosphate 1-O-acyltransferase PlsY [Candidatus Gastranaerophilales bacterium]
MTVFGLMIIIALISYLIGSIPTGYIIVKLKTGEDIRNTGSGSTGATNVKRVLGKKWFFTVMILDAIKGMIPVILTKGFVSGDTWGLLPVSAAIMVIIGHSKPVFLNFKGGKSVASGIGTLYALNPFTGLILTLIWGVITWVSKYVSIGSITALIIAPFLMYFLNNPPAYTLYAIIAAIYIIYLHRENIKRLIKGNENKVRN